MRTHQSTSPVRPLSRRLLDLIRTLSVNQPWCYAGDEYLARKLGTTPEDIADLLFGMEEDGLITVQYPPLQKRRIIVKDLVGMEDAKEKTLREREKENHDNQANSWDHQRLGEATPTNRVFVVVVPSGSSPEKIAGKLRAALGDADVTVTNHEELQKLLEPQETQEPVPEPVQAVQTLKTTEETSPVVRPVLERPEPSQEPVLDVIPPRKTGSRSRYPRRSHRRYVDTKPSVETLPSNFLEFLLGAVATDEPMEPGEDFDW